ncbi:MAG: trehalose-phosphatase [Gemmatimonadota bacterium]
MKALRDDLDLDVFFRRVAAASARVLLLDYDGTLAPFREERDQAVPYPGVREAVRAHLEDGRSRVVVVSGRAIEALRPLLGIEPPPEIWGNHGWERWVPGRGLERTDPGEAARRGLRRGRQGAEDAVPGDRVELKPVSVAVHTRGLGEEEAEALLRPVRGAWEPIARAAGLELHAFDGGLELRVPGRDKGTAVRAILDAEPEDAVVAYLGDDRTDEDAFEVLGALGDRALRVLVRPELRDTAADLWIRPPGELVALLDRWRAATGD